jgi:hypothetical protein
MASSSEVFSEGFLNSQKAKAHTVFLTALGLLCLCAVATYLSFSYFKESEALVAHTQEVRAVGGDLEAVLNNAARARLAPLCLSKTSKCLSGWELYFLFRILLRCSLFLRHSLAVCLPCSVLGRCLR